MKVLGPADFHSHGNKVQDGLGLRGWGLLPDCCAVVGATCLGSRHMVVTRAVPSAAPNDIGFDTSA